MLENNLCRFTNIYYQVHLGYVTCSVLILFHQLEDNLREFIPAGRNAKCPSRARKSSLEVGLREYGINFFFMINIPSY